MKYWVIWNSLDDDRLNVDEFSTKEATEEFLNSTGFRVRTLAGSEVTVIAGRELFIGGSVAKSSVYLVDSEG